MSRALIVTPDAEADILDGYRSYEEKQSGLGYRFLDEIEKSLARMVPNPFQYQEVEPDLGFRGLTTNQRHLKQRSSVCAAFAPST